MPIDKDCPVCGHTLDAGLKVDCLASGDVTVDDTVESDIPLGGYVVCVYCRALLQSQPDTYHVVTRSEFLALPDRARDFLGRSVIEMADVYGGTPMLILAADPVVH